MRNLLLIMALIMSSASIPHEFLSIHRIENCRFIHVPKPFSVLDEIPLFPLKALCPPEIENIAEVNTEPFVAIIPHGRLLGKNGIALAPNGAVIQETVVNWGRFLDQEGLTNVTEMPSLSSITGKIAVIACKNPDYYYHWLFDVLTRLHLLQCADIEYDKLCVHITGLPFQKETLSLMGIDESKMIFSDSSLYLEADELIIPSYPALPGYVPQWSCDFLRETFLGHELLKSPPKQDLKIYISREKARNRKIINEPDLWDLLERKGFIKVYLEDLTVIEQAKLFQKASIVIAQHGSGLSNLVFCQPDTRLVEIFGPNFINPCFWRLAHLMKLRPSSVLGSSQEDTTDVFVDVRELEELIGDK